MVSGSITEFWAGLLSACSAGNGWQADRIQRLMSYDYFLLRISDERRLCLGTELTCDFLFSFLFFLDLFSYFRVVLFIRMQLFSQRVHPLWFLLAQSSVLDAR